MPCRSSVQCPNILEHASWFGDMKVVNSRMNFKELKWKAIAGPSTSGTVVSHSDILH